MGILDGIANYFDPPKFDHNGYLNTTSGFFGTKHVDAGRHGIEMSNWNLPVGLDNNAGVPDNVLSGLFGAAHGVTDSWNAVGAAKQAQFDAFAQGHSKPVVDPIEAALQELFKRGSSDPRTASKRLVNQYMKGSLAPYDAQITQTKNDLAESLAQNKKISGGLHESLRESKHDAQLYREQAAALGADQAHKASVDTNAQDAYLREQLGGGTEGNVLGHVSDRARADNAGDAASAAASNDLRAQASSGYADDTAAAMALDSQEQAHTLQRDAQKQIHSLQTQRAADGSKLQYAFAMQDAKNRSAGRDPLKVLSLLMQYRGDNQKSGLDQIAALNALQGKYESAPLWQNQNGTEFGTSPQPNWKPAQTDKGGTVNGSFSTQTDMQKMMQELLIQQLMPGLGSAPASGGFTPFNPFSK